MVFNATFNNISVISLRPVLFVNETGVPAENVPKKQSYCDYLFFIFKISIFTIV